VVLAGPFSVAAILLLAGALSKLWRPAGAVRALRLLGLPAGSTLVRAGSLVEAGVASAALISGGRPEAAAVALSYLCFAGVVGAALAGDRHLADCGCFGAGEAPPSAIHLVLNLSLAAVGLAATVDPVGPARDVLARTPMSGAPFVAFVALAAWFAYLAISALARLEAVADVAGSGRPVR
jgi:hypothetical protein